MRRVRVAVEPLLVGDLGDAQPALVGDVLAQRHVAVHGDARRDAERRVLLSEGRRGGTRQSIQHCADSVMDKLAPYPTQNETIDD